MRSIFLAYFLLTLAGCGGRSTPLGAGGDGGSRSDGQPGPGGKVTVTTNRLSFATGEQAQGTVHNGTSGSVFLPGCSIFNREIKGAQGKWVDRGPVAVCGWEGNAMELKPGASETRVVTFGQSGSWRLSLTYGLGCKKKKPMNAANCASSKVAVSPPVTVATDKATCEELNKQYRAQLSEAKKCISDINMPQCQAKVSGDLSCGCPLFVNNASTLNKLSQQWTSLNCHKLMPPCGIKCSPPAPAGCINNVCTTAP